MLIASKLNSSSNDYSIVNKEFLTSYISDYTNSYTKSAIAHIVNPKSGSEYLITHGLNTYDIILSAYTKSNMVSYSVDVAYRITGDSSIVISFNNIPSGTGVVDIVMVGAYNSDTATVREIQT